MDRYCLEENAFVLSVWGLTFKGRIFSCNVFFNLLHSEQPKLHGVLAVLSATGLRADHSLKELSCPWKKKGGYSKWQKNKP